MFVLCTPQQSEALLEELADIEKDMFTELGLHFKILVTISSADCRFAPNCLGIAVVATEAFCRKVTHQHHVATAPQSNIHDMRAVLR